MHRLKVRMFLAPLPTQMRQFDRRRIREARGINGKRCSRVVKYSQFGLRLMPEPGCYTGDPRQVRPAFTRS